ncbi:MAG: hypothetical protein KC620_05140 [Myxococcales bacterium]|nr:hypothetical protein [Myxococcales bacterium]
MQENYEHEDDHDGPIEDDDDDHILTYLVSNKLEERTIEGREEAIALAKDWSTEDHTSITVERTDGRVKMTFREGDLIDFVYETRKGRTV